MRKLRARARARERERERERERAVLGNNVHNGEAWARPNDSRCIALFCVRAGLACVERAL